MSTELVYGSDVDLDNVVAGNEIVDQEEETLTKQLEREQKEEADEDRRVSQGRPANEVKPGNRIFMRIRDKDRDFGDQADLLTVTLRADSGDQVQVELKETGPHTGEFRAAIPTDELPAGAAASDSAIDHNPLMAIDHSRESFWQSEPDGRTPKALTVDMKQLHAVSRIKVNTPNAAENAPVRGRLLGSHDGVFWFTLAAQPRIADAQSVLEQFGTMKQMVYSGNHTSYTTWAQVAQLASSTQAVTNAVLELDWQPKEGDENAAKPAAVIWAGKLVQPREGAMRIGVKGDLVAVAVNGKVQLAPSSDTKQVDVWLRAGVHELTIFAASKQASAGLLATRTRANSRSAQPQLKPFSEADFDLESAKKFFDKGASDDGSKAASLAMGLDQVELHKETEEFAVGEMNKVNDTEVSFSCGQRHDDITRLLLPFSRNISSVEGMIAAEALRGQMTTGTLGFSPI